jgi:hypothetical protein
MNWDQRNHSMVREGGTWSVPRSGLIFQKVSGGWELIAVMPWMPEMATAAAEGRDVPTTAEALLEYQRSDFACIQRSHDFSGLTVTDPRELLKGGTK